ncbi:MAG: Gfo/Idh/MocA family oxidoreductase [Propionibacteriaceae bacterium]|nr:Gfo/Idh/MocA family oxidoreductase [Propionibacteriaceae bacterium]
MSGSDSRPALRAGVIGLGWAGRQHMAAYDQIADVELVALAGMETDQLQLLAERYGVEHRFSDWRDLIEAAQVDVLTIATPTALHGPIAVAALEAGIHVLSEKPMAENADVARSMVQAAKDNDRVLEVSFNHRRRGDIQALKAIIDDGLLGRIYYAKAGWLRREGIPGLGSWFTRVATAGGGPLMDIGVHMLDMALHLLGEPNVRAATAATYAEFGPKGRGAAAFAANRKTGVSDAPFDVEDLSTAFLRLDDGGTLLLESSWAQWIPHDQCYVTLYGSEGGANIEWGGNPGSTYRNLKIWTEVHGVPAELQPTVPPDGGHTECVLDFLNEVRSGNFDRYRGEEALMRALVVDACYASAGKGSEVTLG